MLLLYYTNSFSVFWGPNECWSKRSQRILRTLGFYKESIVLIKYITLLNTIKFFNYNTHFKKLSYVKTYLYYTELYIKNWEYTIFFRCSCGSANNTWLNTGVSGGFSINKSARLPLVNPYSVPDAGDSTRENLA